VREREREIFILQKEICTELNITEYRRETELIIELINLNNERLNK
jgi:hypothetical protein